MVKTRRRKQPVTNTNVTPKVPRTSASCRNLIRNFHVLLKRRELLIEGSSSTSHELTDIENEIESLGGLEVYQQMSERGQSDERGGGSHKVLVEWMLQKNIRKTWESKHTKIKLLEVGALKHDNYAHQATWIDCTPIDLHSRHSLIQEQDFLKMEVEAHRSRWDTVSLSLVLNFVPSPHDRGKMLVLAHEFLREGGYLFLTLPLPCVANSRYLDFARLTHIITALGFIMLKERWKQGGKMAYWLYQKDGTSNERGKNRESFTRKTVLREGKYRNNFTILL